MMRLWQQRLLRKQTLMERLFHTISAPISLILIPLTRSLIAWMSCLRGYRSTQQRV